jgi:hypothetical protein
MSYDGLDPRAPIQAWGIRDAVWRQVRNRLAERSPAYPEPCALIGLHGGRRSGHRTRRVLPISFRGHSTSELQYPKRDAVMTTLTPTVTRRRLVARLHTGDSVNLRLHWVGSTRHP